MGCKLPGFKGAVGYWGGSTYKRIISDQTAAKVRVQLQEKLIGTGRAAYLYTPVTSASPDVTACTCVKDTASVQDRPCNECYGVGLVPGFRRFLHETLHFGASEASTFSMIGCAVDTRIKPNRILLNNDELSGTIETPDKAYSNVPADTWTSQVDTYLRAAGNAVTTEFSVDNGSNWDDISTLAATSTGTIRLRITLSRSATTDRSPAFEIARVRHLQSDNYNTSLLDLRPDISAGHILVMRPWIQEQAQSDTGRGTTIEWLGDRSWTAPLDLFDTTITIDTPAARISDRAAGPHPFYEYADGIKTGDRVVLSSLKWNEEFGMFTHQAFDERPVTAIDTENPYSLVF